MAEVPETRYVSLGGDRIAYQVLGDGPLDLVYLPSSACVDTIWEYPPMAACLARLASFSRLIMFDRRGSGASDSASAEEIAGWEKWADDARAVMDVVGAERAALFGIGDTGPTAIMFAATQPSRTRALVLFNSAARFNRTDDYPWGLDADGVVATTEFLERAWGGEEMAGFSDPGLAEDQTFVRWLGKTQRLTLRPREAAAYFHWVQSGDVREVLPAIAAPTLVVHRKDQAVIGIEHGRYLAEHIRSARLIELPGVNLTLCAGPLSELDPVEEFLTRHARPVATDRMLATVLFTDIVDSTPTAATLGDSRWRKLLDSHDAVANALIDQHLGRLIRLTGDGVVASFDGPGRAIGCACAIRDALLPIGIRMRAGIHTGEIELRGDDIAGIAVHIAQRVQSLANTGEVLVSETVPRLVIGSGIEFAERGEQELKGVPGTWRLYAVTP